MASDSLSEKQTGIARIAACTARGDLDGLEAALNRGLDCGLSVTEIKEVLVQLYAYCGFPRCLNAINAFMQVYDRRTHGAADGGAASGSAAAGAGERPGQDMQRQMIRASARGHYPDFELSPALDVFLKEHFFADVFGRGELSFEDREIVTTAALSTLEAARFLPGMPARGGRSVGLSGAQVQEILRIAGDSARGGALGLGEENAAAAAHLSGRSYVKPLTTEGVASSHVTFEPGCRHHWHIRHKSGQVLYVTSGRGFYQEWEQEARELNQGDVVNIPAEVKYWLGAAPDSWFSHIALQVPVEGASSEWLEPVDDVQYARLR